MALKTRCKFYYGAIIPSTSVNIAFQELSGPVRNAVLVAQSYGIAGMAAEIQRALRAAGTQDYVVSIDRSTRLLTISSPANFTIFIATGPFAGAEIYSVMGFPLADQTGANSYTGTSPVAKEFIPQFFLLDYLDTEKLQSPIDATINETGSGALEVIRYGVKKFMRCSMDFITNVCMGADSWIEQDLAGVENAEKFLQDITQKRKVEFMPDRDSPELFQTFVLESTGTDSKGLAYQLVEMSGYDDMFTTGLLTFRLQE